MSSLRSTNKVREQVAGFIATGLLVASSIVVLPYVYRGIGLGATTSIIVVFILAVTSILLSDTNIPLTMIKLRRRYDEIEAILALNVGGTIIPLIISTHIVVALSIAYPLTILLIIVGVLVVSAISYRVSRVVDGLGIMVPVLVPALTASSIALILAEVAGYPISIAGPISYVSGTIGTLLGVDVFRIREVVESARNKYIISIGGMGSFDTIYMVGLLSATATIVLSLVTSATSP